MLDWFDYHGHICIAFEMLGLSVFDFLVSAGQPSEWHLTPDTPDTRLDTHSYKSQGDQ